MSTTEEIPADWQVEDNMVPPKDGLVADAMFDDETSQGRDGDGDPLDQNAEEESRPTRTTRMTAKAIEYQRSLLLKDRNRMVNRLERKGNAINKLLSLGSITAIEEALSQYDDTARLFQETHRKYTKFVPIEEKANDDGWYDTIDDEIFNIKHQAISVLRELKQKEDVSSRCSRTSRKSRSIRSGAGKGSSKSSSCSRSTRSSNSSNGSVKEQMLEENLRIAELQTEADFLEEQYKTSFLAASLKHRQEMAKASARMKVLQQQDDQIRIKDEHLNMLNEQKVNDIKEDLETSADKKYSDTANDFKGDDVDDNFNSHYNSSCQRRWIKDSAMKKEASSSTSSSTRVNEMLCQLLKVQSAPEVDVEAFNGDPLDFNFFMMMFKEVVETKVISEGYAVKCSSPAPIGKTWYLPHHGVYHPKKPGKIRVVLDCGAECDGKSLNSELLSGPDLTNQLVGILTRFRQERIGIMADIQAMYYQVFVPENQRSFLRFLWWEDHDITRPPVDYEMRVHVFGATSSANCANYALRRTASDNMKGFSEDITETPAQNFYVDDMLKSKKEVQESIVFIKGIKKLCQLGGFNLTKFVVNSYEVLKTIPVDDRGPIVKEVSICDDIICATERALGVLWKLKEDAFIFDLKLRDKPLTRRGLLSAVSSIYDPLGFISPLMLKARIILRDLCQKQVGWDDNLPDEAIRDWLNWKRKLNLLDDISIPRCYKPSDFGEVSSCTIHHFSDASEKGYGQVSYLRLINKDGKVHVSFLMGKSRVTPIKFVSIPRLELCAAVLSSKMSRLLMQELQVDISKQVFWTDSQVVLSYLQARNRRFKTFVANRIQMIKSLTDISDWKYVKSSSNPADISSRGINPDEKKKIEFWFNGPEFLWTRQEPWKDNYVSNSVLDDDPEVKTTTTVNVVLDKHSVIL